jgi:osmotically-inducible protein OsmY
MAQYDRNSRDGDRNDFGRRSDNRFDRYANERGAYNDRSQNTWTGDWRDDESRSRGERTSRNNDNDRGFFERAADQVTSWFSSDDDRNDNRSEAERERERYYERRFNTEGARGSAGRERDYSSTFDTRYGQNVEENRLSHTNQDDSWRTGRDNTASWQSADSRRTPSSYQSPERFSRDQPDGREAGRDYYNRLNQDLRSGSGPSSSGSSPYRTQTNQSSPYSQSGSTYGSYGRTGSSSADASRYGGGTNYGSSNYGSSNYGLGSSSNSGTSWSNQSGTYGDNSGSYGSASRGQFAGKGPKGWRRSDDRVKEDICEYLERNAMIDASDVDITVAEGVVTLTGTVPDRQMKRMCEDEIENMPGVKDVNNQLRVNRESSSSDSSSSRTGSSSNTTYGSSNGSTMGSDGASNSGMSASSSNGNSSSQSSTSRTDGTSGSSKKSGSSVS